MEKQIRDIIGQHVGGTYEAKQKAVEEILLLFDVSSSFSAESSHIYMMNLDKQRTCLVCGKKNCH